MIAWLVLVAAALAVGGLLAAAMLHDPGYVLIAYGGATVETSVWLALGVLVLAWLAVAIIRSAIRRSRSGGARLQGWMRRRRNAGASARSLQGTMLLAEGRWQDAQRALQEAAEARRGRDATGEHAESVLADYLGAARAASAGGRAEQRDTLLDDAKLAVPEAAFAIDLVRAELQQEGGQWQGSIATLDGLRRQAPRHPLVLERLFEAHRAMQDWAAVAELAPALPDSGLDGVEAAVWRARLSSSRQSDDAAVHVRNTWAAMPKRLREDESLLLDFAELAAPADAEAALRRGLQHAWRPSWVRRYGALAANPAKQQETAEGWLVDHPDDADLLLALGRLARAADRADQAGDYLARALSIRRDAETLVELAELAADRGDSIAANGYYREAARRLAGAHGGCSDGGFGAGRDKR